MDDEAAPQPILPSRLSVALSRLMIHVGRVPGRSIAGAAQRRVSRNRGGRRFVVPRPGGIKLDAWLSPRDENTPLRLPVVIGHGLLETKERHFKLAWKLNAHGHDVLLFDHRIHGRSTGKCNNTFGIEERHDVRAVIDDAHARGFIGGKVITLGFSLGGATVIQHAAIDDRVAGVIALAPFGDLRSAINSFRKRLVPWLDEGWVMGGFDAVSAEAGFKVDEASAIEAFKHIEVPVLLVEGDRDSFLPGIDHVHKLAAAKPDGKITVLRIHDATHNSLVHRSWPELDEAVAKFCDALGQLD